MSNKEESESQEELQGEQIQSKASSKEKKVKKKLAKSGIDLYKIVGIPLVLLILVGGLALMGAVTELRIKELKLAMQDLDDNQGAGRSIGLIVRYNMIKNRMLSKAEIASDYLNEGEMMAVLSGEFDNKSLRIDYFRFFEKPATVFVNALSFILGDKPIRNFSEDKGNKLIEVAYFFERKRKFKKASKVYEAAIRYFEDDPKNLAYIYLHRGFCLSLTGERIKALIDYDSVIKLVPNGEMKITAQKLKNFLTEVQTKLAIVEKLVTSVSKGKAFYDLMAYNKAIETMNEMERNNIRTQKLYFYRGRAYEEIGNTKKALADYRKVISISKYTLLATNANRRIFMLGSYYSSDVSLKKESKKNAVTMHDETFIKKSEVVAKAVDTKKVSEIKKDIYTKKAIEFVNEKTDAKLEVPKIVEAEETFSMSSGEVTTKDLEKEIIEKNETKKPDESIKEDKTPQAKKLKDDADGLLSNKDYDGAIAKYTQGKTLMKSYTNWDQLIASAQSDKVTSQKKSQPKYTAAQLKAFSEKRNGILKQRAEEAAKLKTEVKKLKLEGDSLLSRKKYDAALAKYKSGRSKLYSYTNWNILINKTIAAKKSSKTKTTTTSSTGKNPKQVIRNPKASKQERKAALKKMGKVTKVFTEDGNVFVGAILYQTDSHLTLATVFGNIKIPKEKIAMQLKVDSKVAIK